MTNEYLKLLTKGETVKFSTNEAHPVKGSGVVEKISSSFIEVEVTSDRAGEYSAGTRLVVWPNELV